MKELARRLAIAVSARLVADWIKRLFRQLLDWLDQWPPVA